MEKISFKFPIAAMLVCSAYLMQSFSSQFTPSFIYDSQPELVNEEQQGETLKNCTLKTSRNTNSKSARQGVDFKSTINIILVQSANVLCFGDSSGYAQIEVEGGTPPYNIIWDNGESGLEAFALAAGQHAVSVTDALSEKQSLQDIFIGTPDPLILVDTIAVDPYCAPLDNGFLQVFMAGGIQPYSYLWSNDSTVASIDGLGMGLYSLTVADDNNCKAVFDFTLSFTHVPEVNIISELNTLMADGVFSSYLWSTGDTTPVITVYSDDLYTLTVTDPSGCIAVDSIASAITFPPCADSCDQSFELTGRDTLDFYCNGISIDETTFTQCQINGDTKVNWHRFSPHVMTYKLNVTIINLNDIDLLGVQALAGTCEAGLPIDSTMCGSGDSLAFTIHLNPGGGEVYFILGIPDTAYGHYVIDIEEVQVSCTRSSDLSVRLASQTANDTIYCPGDILEFCYELTYTGLQSDDDGKCPSLHGIVPMVGNGYDTTSMPLSTQAPDTNWTWFEGATVAYNLYNDWIQTDTLPNGGILLSDNGTSPLSPGTQLPAGWWHTAGDTAGCPDTIPPGNGRGLPATCDSVNVFTFCFEVLIRDSIPVMEVESDSALFDISIYTFFDNETGCLTDPNCLAMAPAKADPRIHPVPLTINIEHGPVCSGGSAALEITASDSLASMFLLPVPNNFISDLPHDTVYINGFDTVQYQMTNISDTIQVQEFSIGFVDPASRCSDALQQVYVTVYPDLDSLFVLDSIGHTLCHDSREGSIALTPLSSIPINWLWSTGDTMSDLSNLGRGDYSVTVSSFFGCPKTYIYSVPGPEPIEVNVLSISPISCFAAHDGAILTSFTGGTPPYSYLWNTGSGSSDIYNLNTGAYTITVSDLNNCTNSIDIQLDEPDPISSRFDLNVPYCPSEIVEFLRVLPEGGTGHLSVLWSNGDTTRQLDLPSQSSYTVTITDNNGCEHVDSISWVPRDTMPPVMIVKDTILYIPESGQSQVLTAQQFAGESYDDCTLVSIEPPVLEFDCEALGIYFIVIRGTDDNNNVAFDTLVVEVKDRVEPFIFCPQPIEVSMCDTVTYGMPFVFDNCGIETFELISGLGSGSVFPPGLNLEVFRVTDQSGNESTCDLEIIVDVDIDINKTALPPSCSGGSDGFIAVTVTGDHPPFIVEFDDPPADFSNAQAGIYPFTVTDSSGCLVMDTILLPEAPPIQLTQLDVTDPSGENASDGAIELTVIGGMPPYQYTWTLNGAVVSQNEDLFNLQQGVYTVVIRDIFGCELTLSVGVGITLNSEPGHISQFRIYPNPCTDILFIDTPERFMDVNATLTNTIGQEIHSIDLHPGVNALDLSRVKPGIYLVTWNDKGKTYSALVVKQ